MEALLYLAFACCVLCVWNTLYRIFNWWASPCLSSQILQQGFPAHPGRSHPSVTLCLQPASSTQVMPRLPFADHNLIRERTERQEGGMFLPVVTVISRNDIGHSCCGFCGDRLCQSLILFLVGEGDPETSLHLYQMLCQELSLDYSMEFLDHLSLNIGICLGSHSKDVGEPNYNF